MEKAGATAFYPRGEADDTLGLYEYCETWQDGLWGPLKNATEFAPELKANPELGAKKPKKAADAAGEPVGTSAVSEPAVTPVAEVAATPAAAAAADLKEADLAGVPALPACRASVAWGGSSAKGKTAAYPLGCTAASPPSVGLYTLNAGDPQLESAWSQPLTLSNSVDP
jgi:hypothetical protein